MTAMLTAPVLVASLVMLTSCIDSADDLDPSDWYSSAVGAEPAPEPGDVPGSGDDYPELGSVPEEPVNVSSAEEIDRVAESLAADLANAQYTSDIVRADDETTPSAIPLPTVAAIESESVTVITPGEEIEIAEASVVTVPAVEPVETAAVQTLAVPPTESQLALADEIGNDTLIILPAESTMDVAVVVPVESRIETETILGEDGELVGSITTVVATSLVSGDQNEADMMMAVAAAENMEPVEETIVVMEPVEETIVVMEPAAEPANDMATEMVTVAEPINETIDLPGVSDETLVILPAPTPESQSVSVAAVPDTPAVDDGSTSLVALSERSADDTIVVVPEYMAAADISSPEPVGTVSVTAEPEVMVEVLETVTTAQVDVAEVETVQASASQVGAAQMEQENFVTEDGELVGSVTRVIETTMVLKSDGEPVEPVEIVTQPAEVEIAVLEPEPVTERVSVTDEMLVIEPAPAVTTAALQPSAATTAVPVISSAGVTFDDLFGASSPNVGTAVQNVAAVGSPTTTINDATFTTAGTGNVAQTLAAIIRFGNGSSSLGADERHIVAQLAAIHAQTGGPIRLVGHASKSGGNLQSADAALVNFKISLDRATAVANELIRNGVPRSDILVEAAAASDSMAADAGIQNEAVDRRVEVFFGV